MSPAIKRRASRTSADTQSLRLRAAWLYYSGNLTQKAIAERLGVSRPTVVRMLEAALKRAEVQIWIADAAQECIELALMLEDALGLDEAIVVPGAGDSDQTARAVGLALGHYLSGIRLDRCRIGVGWGRTLSAALAGFRPSTPAGVEVISLLGGVVRPDFQSPIEFTWRLAAALDADCFLLPAPLVVDGQETKRRLIDACGLAPLFERARELDVAIIGAGAFSQESASLASTLLTPVERDELAAAGAACEVLCTYLDSRGREIRHPFNERIMSVGLDAVAAAGHLILACGGRERAAAIGAVHKRLGVHTLVTDEAAARAILFHR